MTTYDERRTRDEMQLVARRHHEHEFMHLTLRLIRLRDLNEDARIATSEMLGVARHLIARLETQMTTFDAVAAKLAEAQAAAVTFKDLMVNALTDERAKDAALDAANTALQTKNDALQAHIDELQKIIDAGGTVTSDQLDSLMTGLQAIVDEEAPPATGTGVGDGTSGMGAL